MFLLENLDELAKIRKIQAKQRITGNATVDVGISMRLSFCQESLITFSVRSLLTMREPHYSAALLRRTRFAMIVSAATVFGQAPVVDIDIHKNRNLWKAQRNIAIAYESVQEAQKSNPPDLSGHTQKALDLLFRANRELNLAAKSADKH